MARKPLSIGQYLLDRLHRMGVEHIFGIPGDYVLGLYQMIERSPIRHIGTTREDSAGFAADAYARLKGIGCACVTYCVGGLNMTNPTAEAYAEKSPVVVISGAPGMRERQRDPLLHHKVRDFGTQLRIYRELTVASAALEDPMTAHSEIDRVLHAVERYRRPGYIELPRDVVDFTHAHRPTLPRLEDVTDEGGLADCMDEACGLLNASHRPVVLAGVELHRFGMQDALAEFVNKTQIPVAATLLGKSVIREDHPFYLGVYEGAMGRRQVQEYVESCDCVLMLGCLMTDIDMGIFTANINPRNTIFAASDKIAVGRHVYENIPFRSLMSALLKAQIRQRPCPNPPELKPPWGHPPAQSDKITVATLFGLINDMLTQDTIVICDIGESLFGAVDLVIPGRTEFLGPAYYSSMGFAVPAAVGAQLAKPALRPLVIVGDGAFHMTGMELSTAARLGQSPIVIVLNNRGYSTERQIQDGPFNDIAAWDFSKIPAVLGAGKGYPVRTAGQFRRAMSAAIADRKGPSILDVHLDPYDTSPALRRLGERLGQRIKSESPNKRISRRGRRERTARL